MSPREFHLSKEMYKYEATIRRWVDGDTVDVDIDLGFGIIFHNQRIRLYGIDAYESRTRDLEEKSKGLLGTSKASAQRKPRVQKKLQ